MRIQIGQVYMSKVLYQRLPIKGAIKNKTLKYLLPLLKEYGKEMEKQINDVFKVAVGVGDMVVKNRNISYAQHLFLLLDSATAPYHFKRFIKWIREQTMFEDDYVYGDIQKSTFHMIVLRMPEKHYTVFEKFKQGHYSQMFDLDTIDNIFSNHPDVKAILIKDHNYKIRFTDKVNRLFDSNMKPSDATGELDLPPRDQGEVFNHHLKKGE